MQVNIANLKFKLTKDNLMNDIRVPFPEDVWRSLITSLGEWVSDPDRKNFYLYTPSNMRVILEKKENIKNGK